MYVSTWKGLLIYDVSTPADPQRLSYLPIAHFENEDVDSGNGLVIISNDPSEGIGLVYVIDVRDPKLPKIVSIFPNGFIAPTRRSTPSPGAAGRARATSPTACRAAGGCG